MNVRSLDNEPRLLAEAEWAWKAFQALSARRLIMDSGPQPIQVSEIATYAAFHGITDATDMDDLFYYLSVLDREWLDFVHGERNKAARKAKQEADSRARQARARRR